MGLNTTTKTVNDVLTDVKRTFGDESAVQVSDADIIRWINVAQREILITNRILRATGTTDITAGVSTYQMIALKIVSIQSIHYKGRKLQNRSFQEAEEYIQKQDPLLTVNSDPILWYEWGGTINLYPVPTDTVVGGLVVYYIKEPTLLTVAADLLSVPDSYYESVVRYVMARAYELDEDTEGIQLKMGAFTAGLNSLSDQETDANNDVYPRITVLAEDM